MHRKFITAVMMLTFALVAMAGTAMASEDGKKTPAFKEFHSIVDYEFVAKYAVMPKPKGAVIVDSRPYKPKYVDGYIPTAVSIPNKDFDAKLDMLPENKDDVLIFYCGGFT